MPKKARLKLLMNKTVTNFLNKLKSPKILITVGILGIALIFISSFFDGNSLKKTSVAKEIDTEEYRLQLEKDIKKIVTDITGSRDVTVLITLESGIKYQYADIHEGTSSDKTESNSQITSSETKQGYITVKTSSGGEEALLVTAQMPEVRGVAIVCDGGDNEIIKEKIKNTVMAALNITSKRVYIAGGNSK